MNAALGDAAVEVDVVPPLLLFEELLHALAARTAQLRMKSRRTGRDLTVGVSELRVPER